MATLSNNPKSKSATSTPSSLVLFAEIKRLERLIEQKQSQRTGPPGAPGTNGRDGTIFRTGSGAPSSGLGANGDVYVDLTVLLLYQKVSGVYVPIGKLVP